MNKLKELRLLHEKKQREIAEYLGIDRTTYGKYETGASEPDFNTISKIADYYEVSIDFLFGRSDEMILSESTPDNIFPLHTKRIPLLGDIACGEPIFADEQHGNYVVTSDNIEADFCLRAKGDSMTGARILDGDIVFIRSQPEVENGQIAAVIIDNEATLKRVYFYPEKQKLVLNPENPAYEPYVYVGSELSQVRILGRAVAFQSVVR